MRALLALVLSLSGCAHTVTIESEPPGAELFVDGKAKGKTPVSLRETSGFFRHQQIRVEKEGYATLDGQIFQTQPMWVIALPSLCLPPVSCIGLRWALRYPDSYTFVLSSALKDDGTSAPFREEDKAFADPNAAVPF